MVDLCFGGCVDLGKDCFGIGFGVVNVYFVV